MSDETPLDFFGVYAAPGSIEDSETRILDGDAGRQVVFAGSGDGRVHWGKR